MHWDDITEPGPAAAEVTKFSVVVINLQLRCSERAPAVTKDVVVSYTLSGSWCMFCLCHFLLYSNYEAILYSQQQLVTALGCILECTNLIV